MQEIEEVPTAAGCGLSGNIENCLAFPYSVSIKNYFKEHSNAPVLQLQTSLLMLALRLAEAKHNRCGVCAGEEVLL